jgi:hypothetical protein
MVVILFEPIDDMDIIIPPDSLLESFPVKGASLAPLLDVRQPGELKVFPGFLLPVSAV